MKKKYSFTCLISAFFLFIGTTVVTYATPYVYVEMGRSTLEFQRDYDWNLGRWQTVIKLAAYPGFVSGASYASDPIIGKYQVMYVPAHPTTYDYILQKEIAPGVWSLSNEASIISLAASGDPRYSTNYLRGTATALTIDFNAGSIQWTAVENLTSFVSNLPTSQVLRDFSNYTTGSLTFSFSVTDELKKWISSPSGSCIYKTSYWTTWSAGPVGVPEPQTWMLLIVGLAMVWFSRQRLKIVYAFR
ncbi:MAG: hypothetical protein N2572_00565 [Syntrophales bacterium]|nr:hypothetical protein [Syntrophales bacterium]